MKFSLVIETENLAAGGLDDLQRCLDSLAHQELPVARAEEVLVLIGGHLDPSSAAQLQVTYPWLSFHQANGNLSYLEAKKLGGSLATGEVVVFADSDVAYRRDWLARLMAEFERRPDAAVICSDTRVATDSAYGVATQSTWMLATRPSQERVGAVSQFNLNNFAIRRDLMLASYFDDLPLYRGSIRFWRQRFLLEGRRFYRIPEVMAWHLPPRSYAEWWRRMFVFGADTVAATDYKQLEDGAVIHRPSTARRFRTMLAMIPQRLRRTWQSVAALKDENRHFGTLLIGAMPIIAASLVVQWIGALAAAASPRIGFDLLTKFEE